MIEFKRAGDVMVFECPAFKVEISASDAERIVVNPDLNIAGSGEMMQLLTDAFKILDMMIEHKARQTHVLKPVQDITFDVKRSNPGKVVNEMHVKVNVDTEDAEKAPETFSEQLNNYVWKSESGNNPPGHRFREFMKREGL